MRRSCDRCASSPACARRILSLGQKKRDAMHRSVVHDTQTIVMVDSQVRLRTALGLALCRRPYPPARAATPSRCRTPPGRSSSRRPTGISDSRTCGGQRHAERLSCQNDNVCAGRSAARSQHAAANHRNGGTSRDQAVGQSAIAQIPHIWPTGMNLSAVPQINSSCFAKYGFINTPTTRNASQS